MAKAHLGIALAALAALLSACGAGTAGLRFADVAPQLPPIAPDRARFYFYRDYELYESMARPYITLNGEVAGISEPGGVSYRDVAPGTYLVAVRNYTLYPDQDKTVTVKAGESEYVKIESLKSYASGMEVYEFDTFVVVIVDPDQGRRDIAPKRYFRDH
jgi:predicted RNA-binding protein with TRAM domain